MRSRASLTAFILLLLAVTATAQTGELVRPGAAFSTAYPADGRSAAVFAQFEAKAREAAAGQAADQLAFTIGLPVVFLRFLPNASTPTPAATEIPASTPTPTLTPTPELTRSLPAECGLAGSKGYLEPTRLADAASRIVLERGKVITVTNDSDEVNGDTTAGLDTLVRNPGPDGISLREVLTTLRDSPQPATIRFDPRLDGATVGVGSWDHSQLPRLRSGSLVINGDVDGDGTADITLENQVGQATPGHNIFGLVIESSNNTLYALHMVGWPNAVLIDAHSTHQVYSGNTVAHMMIEGGGGAIAMGDNQGGDDKAYDHSDNAWLDTTIVGNVLHGTNTGIGVGLGPCAGDRIERLVIQGNTVVVSPPAGQYPMGISLAAGYWLNNQGNTIRDVLIADNDVQGPMEFGLYIASGMVGSTGNLIERVSVTGNHIKQTSPLRDNGAPLDALTITTGDGASSYGHPNANPVVYPDNNVIRDIWLTRNVLEGQGGQGVSISAGCCGARNNTIEGIYMLGNEIRGVFPGSGWNISGIYLLGSGSGQGDLRSSAGNRISEVFIQQNTIQLANQRLEFGGQEFVSGGVGVAPGVQSEHNSIQNVWIVSNEITAPIAGISLLGGWSLTPGWVATANMLSGVKVWCNTISSDLSMLQPYFPTLKGINLAGGYGPTRGNRVADVLLQKNSVMGMADDVSVFQNAGTDSADNVVDYQP
ncbi:MAG: hypothetical protein BWY10_01447 [Chloroflexi bacterium ADurb.Bin180]|nr:MAG: hypothetical protein BWY10_01447 [Chloroflexi bacterium ADurb.Bin180]